MPKTWVNYAVTVTLGLAFSITLIFITWSNAIESTAREFSLASNSIEDTVARNVQTANNSLNSLATFLQVSPALSQEQYAMIASSLLELHPFMEGAVYVTRDIAAAGQPVSYNIQYQNMRSADDAYPLNELLDEDLYAKVIDTQFESGSILALGSGFEHNGWKGYWILRALNAGNDMETMSGKTGFAAILVNTGKLAGSEIGNADISLSLFSDLASLSGRQLLYQNKSEAGREWIVNDLVEENIIQFPYYSVRLSITKAVAWSEVEKTMVFISLLIGVGLTLLLVALVKAKDEQEQQLRERNAIIEAQVYAQTEELAKARDQALEASLMKSSFLASMSHEIRTPLNAIIGMSDLLSETKMDYEQKKYVAVFKKAGDTLLSLVNDILDLSKIEADQLVLEQIEFNLVDTIEESAEIYTLKAAEKSLELICDIQPDIRPVRFGDPSRLRQVLLNLISNALKFTDEGQIIISVNADETSGADGLQIAVTDTGTGIPADKLEKIFESFSQADSSTTRKYGGTGLGLTISRRLIEMMGGSIWVESEPDKGSRFIIKVSIPVIAGHKDNEPGNRYHFKGKALVVDDNAATRQVLASYLDYAGSGTETLDSTDAVMAYIADNASFSETVLMLVDADMPETDGFDLVRQLREKGVSIPVLMMLNPATLNHDLKSLRELDIENMYITKPVKSRELFRLIDSVLGTGQIAGKEATAANSDEDVKELNILLVDDNPDNRLLVKAYLKKLPYTIDEAENGQEAVDKFRSGKFDLVLMDVQMPVMDGREATRKIRTLEQELSKSPTPIIALTAHAIKEEIDKCIEAGCDSHLSKPVKKSTLISSIRASTTSG